MRPLVLLPLLAGCATSPVYQTAHHVNASVNSRIAFMHDQEQYGRDDLWVLNPAKGDCEDYAITKVAELQARGIQARVGICLDEEPAHAVALVEEGRTTWVLDNRLAYPINRDSYGCRTWLRQDLVQRLQRERTL